MAANITKLLLAFLLVNSIYMLIQAKECPARVISSPCKCVVENSEDTKVICRGIHDVDTLYKVIQKFRSFHIDVLQLVNMKLRYFPAGLFEGLSVEKLVIESSHLDKLYPTKNFNATAFEGLESSLRSIEVKNTNTPSNWFWPDMKHFNRLMGIEFSNSPFSFVGQQFARFGGGSIAFITFSNCKVDRIHPHAFQEMTELIWVNFANNRLMHLERPMFPTPAIDLQTLIFRDNHLTTLDENMFENMPKLNWIDLSGNEFKQFHYNAFFPVLSQVKNLYLNDNPYECKCSLKPLRILLEAKDIEHNDLESITCINEGQFKKTKLADINFDSICRK